MKSKVLSTIQVQLSCCGWLIGNIWWLANLFVLNLAFGWKIFLQIEKWAKCHLLLKCDLKTSSYDIWFFCAPLGSKFWIFEAFMRYLWVFHDSTRFIFEFLLKLAHISRLKVFMQYLRFLDFYMSNDPKLELELRKLAEFRLVRFLVARTVRG